jgi:hypothetical protein
VAQEWRLISHQKGHKKVEGISNVGFPLIRTMAALGLLLILCPAPSGAGQDETIDFLATSVRELGLGEEGFIIGAYLSEEQFESAQGSLLDDTYPGTIKFPAGDVAVVADDESRLILAIYKRLEDVRANDVQQMIGHLMGRFGEPTTMAHGSLVYWAFGPEGKIAEESFLEAKDTGVIDILATVKFNSTLALNPGMDNENTEETGTIYYIIASDRLLETYIAKP